MRSLGELSPADHHRRRSPADLEERSRRSIRGLGHLVDRITPWLLEVGSWIFGGLTALNLVVFAALIPVVPADVAILIAFTTLACALPLNVAGLFLLRLIKDSTDIRLDDLALRSFQKAGFPDIEAYFPPPRERRFQHKRRSNILLGYAAGIATLGTALTITGLAGALWHVAWWIGLVLCAALVLSVLLVVVAVAHSLPSESDAEREVKSHGHG